MVERKMADKKPKPKSKQRIRWSRLVLFILVGIIWLTNAIIFANSSFLNSEAYIKANIPGTPPDETPPVITLKGEETMSIAVGTVFSDPGAEANDARSEATLTSEGEVDGNTVGEYTITYTAKDEHNNTATATRTVKVIEPTGVIYLTFDDGPGDHTARLLDVLAKYNVKATFFVTGAGSDDMIKREYDEGHSLALHTFSHDYSYVYSSVDNFFADLYRVQERVKNITGYTSMLMRFPGGSSNTVSTRYDGGSRIMSRLVNEVESRGFTYFDWNITSGDAGGIYTADGIYERVTGSLKPGGSSVVLQHDIKGFSVDAVERIILFGKENGYIFAKLDNTSFTAHHGVNN
ncbi:MAG: polysaccharide deacetylase family protein [Candidatus Saccharibacteria bacterium]|nr:polysaccharide deacetylase family protein [Candidatus Saccharibacteria bacterium]